jgi:hypothetical protein
MTVDAADVRSDLEGVASCLAAGILRLLVSRADSATPRPRRRRPTTSTVFRISAVSPSPSSNEGR